MNAYAAAVKQIADERRAELDAGLLYFKSLLLDNAELAAAYDDYQTQSVLHATGKPNALPAAVAELKKQAIRAGVDKTKALPPCRCAICNDTGYADGKYCRCVIKRVIESDKNNLVLPQTDLAAAAKTAPKAISKVYAAAEKYISAFPDGDKPFFLLFGSSGTGKTVLASAIATAVMSKGGSIVTVSAFDFVKRAKDYHAPFATDDYRDLFTPMLDCDLLCIDDLGTETMLKNITAEYLYTVVNERWLHNKYTVITSNLTPDAVAKRYGMSIASRLFDKNRSLPFMITAPNERV